MDIRYRHIKKIKAEDTIDLNNSLLIIGPADNNNLSGEIIKVTNIEEIESVFGYSSKLTKATRYAFLNNVEKIYIYNTYETDKYINVASHFKHYRFNYIVPIDINIRDEFYNPVSKKMVTYAEFYLDNLSDDSMSTIIMTDKHADLYYNLDDYILEMESIIEKVKRKSVALGTYDKWTNMIFVCNMLKDIDYSNISLATSLAITEIGKYPKSIKEKPVYDYDAFDIRNKDICYFKENLLTEDTTVENLVNMRTTKDVYKAVMVDEIIKYIKRNLDLSEFIGTKMTRFTEIYIANEIRGFMNKIDGKVIKNYNIKSIDFVLTGPNVGNILIETEITPKGTFESLNINLEV